MILKVNNIIFSIIFTLFVIDLPINIFSKSILGGVTLLISISLVFISSINKNSLKLLILSYIFIALSFIVTFFKTMDFYGDLLGVLYLCASLFSIFMLLNVARKADDIAIQQTIKVLLIILLLGVCLERFFEASHIFELFNQLFRTYGYDAAARDISMVGFVRPKFIFNEPSDVGKLFSMLSLCYFLIDKGIKTPLFVYLFFSLFFYYVSGTVFSFLGFIIFFVVKVTERNLSINTFKVFFMVLFLIIPISLAFDLNEYVNERYLNVLNADDESSVIRFWLPLFSTLDVLKENYLLGLGIMNKSSVEYFYSGLLNVTFEVGYLSNSNADVGMLFNNGVFEIVQYLGLVGVFLLLALVYFVSGTNSNYHSRGYYCFCFLLVFLIFLFSMGGINTPKVFFYPAFTFYVFLRFYMVKRTVDGDFSDR